MQKCIAEQVCFPSSDGQVLLCNAIYKNGELWETESGKWIPIPIKESAPVQSDALSKE
jgi:hypothetical protein